MSAIVPSSQRISRIALYCLIALSWMGASTCRTSKTEELPDKDKEEVPSDESLPDSTTVQQIRNAVLNNIPELSDEEKQIILERAPLFARYEIAGPVGQYGWRWDLPTGRSVSVWFTGDINHVDINQLQMAVRQQSAKRY